MKLKSKFGALTLAVALGAGMLVGCNNNKPAPAPTPKYLVNVPTSSDYQIHGIVEDKQYVAGANVSFTVEVLNEDKEIVQAGYTLGGQRNPVEPVLGEYTFAMPESNISLFVTLKDIERYALSHTGTIQVDGDPVAFSLILGTDPVTTWTLEATAGADHVSINGHNVTGVSQGEVTLAASVGGQQVATETVTVERSAHYTIADAIAAAKAEKTDFSDNTKNTKTDNFYKVSGKVITRSNFYQGAVNSVLYDGTGLIYLQRRSMSSESDLGFNVGDVVEVSSKISNYYGLLELDCTNLQYLEVITKDIPAYSFPAMTGAQFDAAVDSVCANTAFLPLGMRFDATSNNTITPDKVRFNVDGSSKYNNGLLAMTAANFELEHADGVSYTFNGFLTGLANGQNYSSASTYSNYLPDSQTKKLATSVSIDQGEEATVTLNNDLQLTYTTVPAGAGVEVSWVSSQPSVATVSATGLVHASAAGQTVITLTVDGNTDTITINVSAELKPATRVVFSQTGANAVIGTDLDLKPLLIVEPEDTTDVAIWESGDPETATVANGVVTPLKVGQAVITVTYNETHYDSIIVDVTAPHGTTEDDPLSVDEAREIGAALAGQGGQSVYTPLFYYVKGYVSAVTTLETTSLLGEMEGMTLRYVRFDEGVDGSTIVVGSEILCYGEICNYNNGTIQLSHSNAHPVKIKSIDNSKATFIKIEGPTSVETGNTIQLSAAVYPAALGLTATFSSLNTDIATVSSDGVVTPVADGVATIKAQSGDVFATFDVTVLTPVSSVAKYTFTCEKNSTAVTDTSKIFGWFTKTEGSAIVSSVASPTNVYAGANGGSGANTWEAGNMLKIGKSSDGGTLTINLSQAVKKIIISGYAWKNTLGLTINGVSKTGVLASNLANKTNVEANNYGQVEYILTTASNSLVITGSTTALCIVSIEFFA